MIKHKPLTNDKIALLLNCTDYREMGDHHYAICHCSFKLNESIMIHLKLKSDKGMCVSVFINV